MARIRKKHAQQAESSQSTIVELYGQRAWFDGGSWQQGTSGGAVHKLLNSTLLPGGVRGYWPNPHQEAVEHAKESFGDDLKVISITPPHESKDGVVF